MKARWALFVALAFAVLRCLYSGCIDLAPDEAYYWQWSRHLDLGYYEQGPGLALAVRLGTALLGDNELGMRLMASLSGLGASVLAIWFCMALGAEALALWMVLAFNGMLLFSVGGVLMMHDSLLGFFWMASLAAAARASRPGQAPNWILSGLFAALGLMSKYTGVLLCGSLLLALALEPKLRSRWALAGALIAACGCLPMLLWNQAHGWPSFQHTFSLAGADATRRNWHALPEFIGSQIGLVTPLLLWIILLGWRSAWRRYRSGEARPAENLLLFSSLPVFLFFTLLSVQARVEGNWPAPAYLGGLVLGGLELQRSGGLRSKLASWALGLAFAFSALAYGQAAWPFLPIPQAAIKADTASRVDGWKELGARVYAERMKMRPSRPSTGSGQAFEVFTACHNYQNLVELSFYQPDHELGILLHDGSIKNQFRYWDDPQPFAGHDAVLVTIGGWELGEMARYFKKFEPLPDEVFLRNGREVRRAHLFRAYGFNPKGAPAFEQPAGPTQ